MLVWLLCFYVCFIYFKKNWKIPFASFAFYKGIVIASLTMIVCVAAYEWLADNVLFESLTSRIRSLFISFSAVTLGGFVFLVIIAKRRVIARERVVFIAVWKKNGYFPAVVE